jgi:hypothetical protein
MIPSAAKTEVKTAWSMAQAKPPQELDNAASKPRPPCLRPFKRGRGRSAWTFGSCTPAAGGDVLKDC